MRRSMPLSSSLARLGVAVTAAPLAPGQDGLPLGAGALGGARPAMALGRRALGTMSGMAFVKRDGSHYSKG